MLFQNYSYENDTTPPVLWFGVRKPPKRYCKRWKPAERVFYSFQNYSTMENNQQQVMQVAQFPHLYTHATETGNQFNFGNAGGNLYLIAIAKAMYEFIEEESKGQIFTEVRLTEKIEAARVLFPDYKKMLRH